MKRYFYALLAGLLVLAVSARCAEAAPPITFSLCEGQVLTFKQPKGTDRLEVRCPGAVEPSFTIVGCIGPSAVRTPPVDVTIIATGKRYSIPAKYDVTCTRMVPYRQVPQ